MEATKVVNVKSTTEYDVYIGRPVGPLKGDWGNPFKISKETERPQALEQYRRWLWSEIKCQNISLRSLASLKGQTLGCWCKPHACHGDVLAAAAEWAFDHLNREEEA